MVSPFKKTDSFHIWKFPDQPSTSWPPHHAASLLNGKNPAALEALEAARNMIARLHS